MTETKTQGEKRDGLFPLLLVALFVAVLWLATLLWMTLSFSNPITLNTVQIQQSDSILLGRFEGKEFVISKAWGIDPNVKSVRLRNIRLASSQPQADVEYLIPVLIKGERFEITPSRVRGIPLIYPSSEKVISDLEEISTARAARSPTLQVLRD